MSDLTKIIVFLALVSIASVPGCKFTLEHGRMPLGGGEVFNWMLGLPR